MNVTQQSISQSIKQSFNHPDPNFKLCSLPVRRMLYPTHRDLPMRNGGEIAQETKPWKRYIILSTKIGICMVLLEIIDKIQHDPAPPIYSILFPTGISRGDEYSPEK